MKLTKHRKTKINFAVLIFFVCLLFTVSLWDYYFNSPREFDRLIASNLVLLMGILFSVAAGLFAWSLDASLRRSEKDRLFIHEIIESMISPLMIVDPSGKIKTVNHAATSVLGYQEDELIDRPVDRLFADGFLASADIGALIEKGSMEQVEKTCVAKNGRHIPVLFAGSVLRDQNGVMDGIVCVMQDISERKKLEKSLFQSEQMKAVGRLAAGIAHDFKNLLIVVAGYSEFLLQNLDSNDPKRQEAQRIKDLATRGSKLARQLLALSGRQAVEAKVISLNTLIMNTDTLLREFLGENIELVTLPATDLGMTKVDLGQIEQVLINLVVNARDAMPEGGKIAIETANADVDDVMAQQCVGLKEGRYVMFSVTDNGCGMSEEVKEHIFEPYFTTKGPDKGTGLGLSTAYGMIKQAGGHILVFSEPGHGAAFKVYLPRVDEPAEEIVPVKKAKPVTGGKETVLVVEDEPLVRNLIVRILNAQGYHILAAANGSEALRLVEEQPQTEIHLLLSDMVMPHMGGEEMARRIRATRPKLKVVFTSGYMEDPFAGRDIPDPSVSFIQKPFSPDALAVKIREVLDQ